MAGVGPDHPLRRVLLGLGEGLGAARLAELTRDVRVGDALAGLLVVLERLAGHGDPTEALEARRGIVDVLSALTADAALRAAWGITDPERLQVPLERAVTNLVQQARTVGTPEALGAALLTIGFESPHAAALLDQLVQAVSVADSTEHAEVLTALRNGTLSDDEIAKIAEDALANGDLGLLVEATFAGLGRGNQPLEQQALRVLALADLLRTLRDSGPPRPGGDATTVDTNGQALTPAARIGWELMRRRAATLLEGLQQRIETRLRPALDEALDRAIEDAGRTASAPASKGHDVAATLDRVRDVARLRAGLLTATLDQSARTAALERLFGSGEAEVVAFEQVAANRDGWPATARTQTLGRLNGLRVARDAIQDLLLDGAPSTAAAVLDAIYDRLNGTRHDPSLGRASDANFREGGVRERLDAARRAGDEGATRRLEEEQDYLERRRVQIIARTSASEADAIARIQEVKRYETLYWSSRLRGRELADIGWLLGGDVPADRILPDVQQYRAQLMPAALEAVVRALDETGHTPDQVAQGFIRALARLRDEDVRAGAHTWFENVSKPWYRRGWIVGNYRLWQSHEIGRQVLEDRRFAEALDLAGRLPAATLQADHPGAFARLVQAGFIEGGRYTVPAGFAYSPDTAGARFGTAHWLDGLNAAQFGEIVATILLPGGAAARFTRALTASIKASRAGHLAVLGFGFVAEAGAFMALSHGARAALGQSREHDQPLAKDFVSTLAVMAGLKVFSRLFQPLERLLVGRTALGRTTLDGVRSTQADAALARLLWRTAGKPLSQLTRADLAVLSAKAGAEGVRIGAEGAAFTAFGTLPVVGHDGRFDWNSLWANVVFVGQMRALHGAGAHLSRTGGALPGAKIRTGADRATRALEDRDVIAEPGEGGMPATPGEHFRAWYRAVDGKLPVTDPQKLAEALRQEAERIAADVNEPEETREAARVLAWALAGGVQVEFLNGPGGGRGRYDAWRKTAVVHVDEILVGLYNRIVGTRGRHPLVGEVLQSLLGTTVHEVLEHGLQGLDVTATPPKGGSTSDPLPAPFQPYAKLHELRAYWTQRLFDPTLGGKNHWYRRGQPVTLADAVRVVLKNYPDVQGVNEKTLRTMYPTRMPEWRRASGRIEAQLVKTLNEIRQRGLTGQAKQDAVDAAVAEARTARAAAMRRILEPRPSGPVQSKVDRLRQVRARLSGRSHHMASFGQPSATDHAVRRLLRGLGIEWRGPGEFEAEDQQALTNLLVRRFRDIAESDAASPEARAVAGEMAMLIEGKGPAVRLHFATHLEDEVSGAYFRLARIAEVYLGTIASSADYLTRAYYGRPATSEDFLTMLMGTTTHEVLAHGFRQQLGLRSEEGVLALGSRPSSRLHELDAFLTQRLIDPTLNGQHVVQVPGRLMQELTGLVDQLYPRHEIEADNEHYLSRIDHTLAERWVALRERIDAYFSGAAKGDSARADLWAAFDVLPLSAEQRRTLDTLLRRHAAAAGMVEEFDPNGPSTDVRAGAERTAPTEPVLTPEMLKASMLHELIFTRILRQGARDHTRFRASVDALRRRRGQAPLSPARAVAPTEEGPSDGPPPMPVPRGAQARSRRPESTLDFELRRLRVREMAREFQDVEAHETEVRRGLDALRVLLEEARADGVDEADLARLLGWFRATEVPLDHEYLRRMENMVMVARANARGLIILFGAGRDAMERFAAFHEFVEPLGARQINLAVLARVKAKAALEAQSPPKPQTWNLQELAIAREVAAAGSSALRWWEACLDFEEGHGLEEVFTAEDLENIGAVVHRHDQGLQGRAVQ